MKIYYWDNEGVTEFNTGDLLDLEDKYSSGQHSGGIVVLAKDEEEAVKLAMDAVGLKTQKSAEYLKKGISEFKKIKGVVYYGDGNC